MCDQTICLHCQGWVDERGAFRYCSHCGGSGHSKGSAR